MTYREVPIRPDISEAQAFELARAASPVPLEREPRIFHWGWVYVPRRPAPAGPGEVSVTLAGSAIQHGSVPYPFTDDEEPVDRFAARRYRRSIWDRLFG